MTARSSSSASRTSSVISASASCRLGVHACMRRSRWPCARAREESSAETRVSGPTTASCCASPRADATRPTSALFFPRADEVEEGLLILALIPASSDIEALLIQSLSATSLFAARFRECAGRALLLPKKTVGKRQPLWAQRKRAPPTCSGGIAVSDLPDRARGLPRVPARTCSTCPRCAACCAHRAARGDPARCRPGHPLTLRSLHPLLVRRQLHVRRRCPSRGAPRTGAHHRRGAAAGAAGRGRAARAARSGGHRERQPRGAPAELRRGAHGPMPCTICLLGLGPLALDEIGCASSRGRALEASRARIGSAWPGAHARAIVEVRGRGVATRRGRGRARDALGCRGSAGRSRASFLEPVAGPARRPSDRATPARTDLSWRSPRCGIASACGSSRCARPSIRLEARGRVVRGRVPARRTWFGALRRRGAAHAQATIAGQAASRDRAGGCCGAMRASCPSGTASGTSHDVAGEDALATVIEQLEGALAAVASVLECEVLPARMARTASRPTSTRLRER